MDALNAQSDSQKKKAVRLDLQLQHETDELLVDCIVTHSLAKSHLKAEAKRTMDRLTSPIVEVQDRAAAAIDKARQKKTNSYVPLMYVIQKQVLDGRRRKAPTFTPAALTSFGELGPGCALSGVACDATQGTPCCTGTETCRSVARETHRFLPQAVQAGANYDHGPQARCHAARIGASWPMCARMIAACHCGAAGLRTCHAW